MPVVAIANSKGGSGKSTLALLLACEIATSGADVVLIDADPRRPAVKWAKRAGAARPAELEVIESGGTDAILGEVEGAASRVPFVLVDLEGVASQLTAYAVGAADLVLVPTQGQHQDAEAALATLTMIGNVSRLTRRPIASAVVLTRTAAAVKSRTERHVAADLRDREGVLVLPVELVEREAYRALWSASVPLREMKDGEAGNLTAARANIARLLEAVVEILR